MSATGRKTRTYRAATLDEVLRNVREELGPDAIVLRQREGIVGGFGGFFGKHCVEVDARPPLAQPAALPLPARAVLDVYDSLPARAPAFEPWEDSPTDDWPMPAETEIDRPSLALDADGDWPPPVEDEPELVEETPLLLDEIERQAAPFAAELAAAVARDPEPEPIVEIVEAVAECTLPEADIVRENLLAAGLSGRTVDALLEDARLHRSPLAPEDPLAVHVRRALARRIRVRHGWRGRRRTVAIVGPSGSGRTLTVARLCHAYATAGRVSTGALSLEPPRRTLDLGTLTRGLDIGLEIAARPAGVREAVERLDADVVIADTPPANPFDPGSIDRVAELLEALRPDETHLLVPAQKGSHEARILLDAIRERIPVDRLLITRLDEDGDARAGIGLSLECRLPISYLAVGSTWGLQPAEAYELAEVVLP